MAVGVSLALALVLGLQMWFGKGKAVTCSAKATPKGQEVIVNGEAR